MRRSHSRLNGRDITQVVGDAAWVKGLGEVEDIRTLRGLDELHLPNGVGQEEQILGPGIHGQGSTVMVEGADGWGYIYLSTMHKE